MAGGPIEPTKPAADFRLPTDVKPKHYDVTVRTDLEKLTFDGYVITQYVSISSSPTSVLTCFAKS